MSDGLLSQKEYADLRGWSKQYVNQLVQKGRIQLRDGKIDPAAADAALRRNGDPTRRPAYRTDGMEEPPATMVTEAEDGAARVHGSFAKARTVREHYRAMREKLEYEQLKGNLLDRQEVEDAQFEVARAVRMGLLQGANEIAARLAGTFGIDERQARDLLTDEIRRILDNAAHQLEREVGEEDSPSAEPQAV